MNFLRKGLDFLFHSKMSGEEEDVIQEVEEEQEDEIKPVVSDLDIEEEVDGVKRKEEKPAAQPRPVKKRERKQKKEEALPSQATAGAEELDPLDLSDNKAAKRIALAGKADLQVQKLDPRTRTLSVSLPKKKQRTYPFIDFPEELIPAMQKLVEERPKLKDQLSLLDCANHSPRLFWNAIYHWKTTDALEQKLQEAGLTTVGRRTRRRVVN